MKESASAEMMAKWSTGVSSSRELTMSHGSLTNQIAQMEVELPSMPVSIRQTYQQRLTTSKAGLEKVKKTLVRSSPRCQP